MTNSIVDETYKDTWSGVIFQDETGAVYGTPTLSTNAKISTGNTLTIESGKTLTIGSNVILSNLGTINNAGTLDNLGAIDNGGAILGYGAMTGNDPAGTTQAPSTLTLTFQVKTGDTFGKDVDAVSYGDAIQMTAKVSKKSGLPTAYATSGTVEFSIGETEIDAQKVAVTDGTATLAVTSVHYNGLSSANVVGTTLTLVADSTTNGVVDTVTVSVKNMGNYEDSTITITVSYSYKSADGTGISSKIAPKDAGNYIVTFQVPDTHVTYIGSVDVPFTIGQKAVTVKPEDKTVTAGEAMPRFQLAYRGLISGEELATSAAPEFSCNTTHTNTAGQYKITWSNQETVHFIDAIAKNYTITKAMSST